MTRIIADQSVNAASSWLLAAVLGLLAVWTAVAGSALWTAFTLVSLAIVLAPALVTSDRTVMPNAAVVGVLTATLLFRTLGPFRPVLVYVALAALALIVAVEIDAFSSAEFTPWFAVAFVVFATMAIAGLWAVGQYLSDLALGTDYLTTRTDLMWELVTATVVGLGAGVLFDVTVLDHSNPASDATSSG